MYHFADAGKTNPIKPNPPTPIFTPKTNVAPKNNLKKPYFPPFYRLPVLIQWKKAGPARTHPERSQPCKNVRTFNNMHNLEQVKKKMHAGLNYPSTISILSILPNRPLERRRYSISLGLCPNSSLPTASTATASKPASISPIF